VLLIYRGGIAHNDFDGITVLNAEGNPEVNGSQQFDTVRKGYFPGTANKRIQRVISEGYRCLEIPIAAATNRNVLLAAWIANVRSVFLNEG